MKKTNWLWDVKISERKAKGILANEEDPRFFNYAQRLFSRVKDVEEAFKIMKKEVFCRNWPAIRGLIEADTWNAFMADYWDKIYKKTAKEFQEAGMSIQKFSSNRHISPQRQKLARQLRKARRDAGFTQKQAGQILGTSQAYISKIENGMENLTIDSLYKLCGAYLQNLEIHLTSG